MDDLQTLLDERACLRLMTDYCLHLDNRQVEPFLDLFTPDATWIQVNEPPYPLVGREAIRGFVDARPTRKINRHMMVNPQVTLDGPDRATGFSIGLVVDGPRGDGVLPVPLNGIELLVEYRDSFTRTANGWRIARREMTRVIDKKAAAAS